MSAQTLLALILFLLPLAWSPGPGNAFFAAIGASRGFRASLPALAGYHVATFIVTALIGMGLGLTLLTEPHFARVLSLAGAGYIFWLAFLFFRAAFQKRDQHADKNSPVRIGFTDGALVLILNPKAYYIIGLLFTQFLVPGPNRVAQVLAITSVFTLNNVVAFIGWTLAGSAMARLLKGDGASRWINIVFGLCMVGVGVWMLVPALKF